MPELILTLPIDDGEIEERITEMQKLAAESVSPDRIKRDQERSERQR